MGRLMFLATRRDVGKTATSLGAFSYLKEHLPGKSIGYMKPVGHSWRYVGQEADDLVKVDKDVLLFRKYFGLDDAWRDLSPIVIERDYTRRFLDGKIDANAQLQRIKEAAENIERNHDFIVVEGTGHAGVGSIVKMNNPQVAKALGCDVVLVAEGGIGSAFDEIALNKALCDQHGVAVKGVVLNKVLPKKADMVSHYVKEALRRWNIPLLGAVPYSPELAAPCSLDFERLFGVRLLSGVAHRMRHFLHTYVISSSMSLFADKLNGRFPDATLFVVHATRADVVLALISHAHVVQKRTGRPFSGGIILASSTPNFDLKDQWIMSHIESTDLPIMFVARSPHDVARSIFTNLAKLTPEDTERTKRVIKEITEHIDLTPALPELT